MEHTVSQSSSNIPASFQASWYFLPHDTKTQKNDKKIPCLRWGHTTTLDKDSLYVYGGTGLVKHSRQWDNVYHLDLESWDWTRFDPSNQAPPPLDSHSAILNQNKLYFFGGNNHTICQSTLYEYDLTTNTWKALDAKGTPPSPREGHCCTFFDDRYMGIYGGWNGEESFDDCYVFDFQTLTWLPTEKESGTKPSPRESQTCCKIRGSMYFFGGQGNNIVKDGQNYENFFNDLFKLKVIVHEGKVSFLWEEIFPKGVRPSKRASHSCCAYKDRYMFIVAGEGYPPDFDEDFSTQNPDKALVKLGKPTKQAEDNDDFNCYPKNDVWYYDIELNQWSRLIIKNDVEFAPRFVHNSEVYKDSLIVFGGLRDYHHAATDISVLSLYGTDPFEAAKGHLELMMVPKPSDKVETKSSEDRESSKMETEESNKKLVLNLEQKTSKDSQKDEFKKPVEIKLKTMDMNKQVTKEMIERTAKMLQRTVVSTSFLHHIPNIITWPFAAFGLLVDNALINKASSLKISYVKNSNKDENEGKSQKKSQKDKEEFKDDEASNHSTITMLDSPYIILEDNGKGWKHQDFLNILLNYDIDCPESIVTEDHSEENFVQQDERKKRINEYGFNLKASCFRLGRTLVFITKHNDEISLGLISVDKRLNTNIHKSQVFYYAWKKSNGEFLTKRPQKYKNIILNALKNIITEEELTKSLDKISTKIIVLDLNLGSDMPFKGAANTGEQLELIKKKKLPGAGSDVWIRQVDNDLKRFTGKPATPLIELSLQTYLSYFFLDPSKAGIEIILNNTPIKYVNIKRDLDQIEGQGQDGLIKIKMGTLLDGILVSSKKMIETVNTKDSSLKSDKQVPKSTKEPQKNEESGQGILLYYDNRLVRRLESLKFGTLDFLLPLYRAEGNLISQSSELFDVHGYIEMKSYFRPNLTKTEIENIYYSNYLYTEVMQKVEELESMSGKRKNFDDPQIDDEGETSLKKVKQT